MAEHDEQVRVVLSQPWVWDEVGSHLLRPTIATAQR